MTFFVVNNLFEFFCWLAKVFLATNISLFTAYINKSYIIFYYQKVDFHKFTNRRKYQRNLLFIHWSRYFSICNNESMLWQTCWEFRTCLLNCPFDTNWCWFIKLSIQKTRHKRVKVILGMHFFLSVLIINSYWSSY